MNNKGDCSRHNMECLCRTLSITQKTNNYIRQKQGRPFFVKKKEKKINYNKKQKTNCSKQKGLLLQKYSKTKISKNK